MDRRWVEPLTHAGKGAPLIVGASPEGHGSKETSLIFGGYDALLGHHQQGAVSHAGLTKNGVNLTYRVPKAAWNGDFTRHTRADMEEGRRLLEDLIHDLQPSVILALGAHAAYDLIPSWATLTDRNPGENSGGSSIWQAKEAMDRRGFFWYPNETSLPCPVLATLHPGSCLYSAMPHRVLLDIDFQRLGAHLRGDLVRRVWPDFIRVRTPADLDPLWEAELGSYDIEIKWGGTAFLCLAIYDSNGRAYLAYGDALKACEEWLRSDRPKLAQNSQFDRYFLEVFEDIKVGGRHEDTICGHWACYPELAGKAETGREDQKKKTKHTMTRKGLNFLASFHLDVPWWKTYTSDPEVMGALCVNDVAATMWAWEIIEPEIDDMGVRVQYERQLAKLPALIAVQKRGFLIDEEMRRARMREIKERQQRLEGESRAAGLAFLQAHSITHRPDGTPYWWYHDARCECCFGGATKASHCDVCAGVRGTGAGGSIRKPDLVTALWRRGGDPAELKTLKKADLVALLPPCEKCEGRGSLPTWDFNPMSSTQIVEILWSHLDVPKYTFKGSPSADEETLRNVLEWAEDEK